jgi:hypothetical protein
MLTETRSRSSEDDVGYDPSSLSEGDSVVVLFNHDEFLLPPGHDRRVYGRVAMVTSQGAILSPTTQCGIRLLWRKVYCGDGDCIVEEVNGESLF